MRTKMIIASALVFSCAFNAVAQTKAAVKPKEEKVAEAPAAGDDGLKLSEDQKKKMKDIRMRTQKEILPLKNQLGEKKARLKTLTSADKPDMNEINKTIDEMSALKAEIAKKRVASRIEIRSILTEEQRLMFDSREGRKGKPGKKAHRGEPRHHQRDRQFEKR